MLSRSLKCSEVLHKKQLYHKSFIQIETCAWGIPEAGKTSTESSLIASEIGVVVEQSFMRRPCLSWICRLNTGFLSGYVGKENLDQECSTGGLSGACLEGRRDVCQQVEMSFSGNRKEGS